MADAAYHFVGSCPNLLAWFIWWITDEDQGSEEIEFDELAKGLAGDPCYEEYMAYRRDKVGIHPRDDWAINFWKAKTPNGLPVLAIQDSGIEHVYVAGDFDLEAEKGTAIILDYTD